MTEETRSDRGWDLPKDEQEALIAMRNDLHRHPELAWKEKRTAQKVKEALEAMGLHPETVAETGVMVEIGEGEGLVVLRADMDALPIQEETNLPFRSEYEGLMHACGHDAHTACLVAVARRLVRHPPKEGRVRLLFQPAEEMGGGAKKMIEEGVLEGATAIYGIHFWSQLSTGQLGIVKGAMMGSVDFFTVNIHGKGGHAAIPQHAKDPIVAASYMVTSLQTIVSRQIDPLKSAVLTIGEFHAGSAPNIIPNSATIRGTIRTLDRETWEKMPSLFEKVVHSTADTFDCEAEITFERMAPPLINRKKEIEVAKKVALPLVGEENIVEYRVLAGEDFAEYLEKIPGAFLFVGASKNPPEKAHLSAPHHNPYFELDEKAFALAVRLLEGCARESIKEVI